MKKRSSVIDKSARLDLFEARTAISPDHARSLDVMATSMIRFLPQALGRSVSLMAPGAKSLTFDEEWLLRLLERSVLKDGVSVEFLLRCQVARGKHHAFRTLVRAVAALLRD